MTSDLAIQEAEERKALECLPEDCELCGEPGEYAKIYGCPCGYNGEFGLPDCPHDKHQQLIQLTPLLNKEKGRGEVERI